MPNYPKPSAMLRALFFTKIIPSPGWGEDLEKNTLF